MKAKAPKPKAARAIEANSGIRRKFAKKLHSFARSFSRQVADEIFLHLAETAQIAQDWSLSNPKTKEDKELLREISRGVLAAWKRDPEGFRQNIEAYVAKHVGEWTENANRAAQKLAIWVARCVAADVTAAQRQAYTAAGLSPDWMRQKWTVPIVHQRISQRAAREIPALVAWSTELITKTATRDIDRLQQVIVTSLSEGRTVQEVRDQLLQTEGFSLERATNVAIDQTNKITQGIARANDAELGIEEGIWIHVPGKYSSRETHMAMNGKRFNLERGMYDDDAEQFCVPGQLPYCRCIYRPIISFDKMKS